MFSMWSCIYIYIYINVFLPSQALKVRQADVTRETVQKSVCVLSRVVSQLLSSDFGLTNFTYWK